jgi:hypothetical protein
VEWTRNGVNLINGRGFAMTHTILSTQHSTYEHRLTVRGKYLAVYGVSVTNSRSSVSIQCNRYLTTHQHTDPSTCILRDVLDQHQLGLTKILFSDSHSRLFSHFSLFSKLLP